MSKGLGLSYVDRMGAWHRVDPGSRQNAVYHGEKSVMPRYYREKIFTETQREILRRAYERKRVSIEEKVSQLDNVSTVALNHARKKWQEDQEYAAEWFTLKKHVL